VDVSVILPSNKSSSVIIESINSLLPVWDRVEWLINLDGVDKSIEDRIHQIGLTNVRIFHETGPLSNVLNFLIRESQGRFIARADDDDLYFDGRLIKQFHFLSENPQIQVVGSSLRFSANSTLQYRYYPQHHSAIALSMVFGCFGLAHPVVMGTRGFFLEHQYANLPAEDYDLWVRGIVNGSQFSNLDEYLCRYTVPAREPARILAMFHSSVASCTTLLEYLLSHSPNFSSAELNLLATLFIKKQFGDKEFGAGENALVKKFIYNFRIPGVIPLLAKDTLLFCMLTYHPELYHKLNQDSH
jgi:glycosyltransferase involved in cell wall biosynthesis